MTTDDELGTCECGAPGTTLIDNGKYVLPICRPCYNDDEQIWLEAVMAFHGHVRDAGLTDTRFAELPPDLTDLIVVCVANELSHRNMPTQGVLHDLVVGAIARYDEWFTPRSETP